MKQLLSDRVAILPDEPIKKQGLIYIPDTAQEKPRKGTVLAIGPGFYEDGEHCDMSVKPGDRVTYGKYAGTEVEAVVETYNATNGEPVQNPMDIYILRESDIMMIWNDEKEVMTPKVIEIKTTNS